MPSVLLRRKVLLAGVLAGLAFASAPARADSVDGDWCSADGKHIAIKGPDITLPDGTQLQGSFMRHSFAYVIPENQAAAGAQMILRLVNEDTIQALAYRGGTAPVTWKRCEHVS